MVSLGTSRTSRLRDLIIQEKFTMKDRNISDLKRSIIGISCVLLIAYLPVCFSFIYTLFDEAASNSNSMESGLH